MQVYDVEWVKRQPKPEFLFFWGHTPKNWEVVDKSCFSQWFQSEFFDYDYIEDMPTAEHYMMAMKARLFNDGKTLDEIMNSTDPKEAKALGRKVKNFDSEKWELFKYEIVKRGNYFKFLKSKKLRDFLLSTGDKILVEASPYDKVWGIGLKSSDSDAHDPRKWRGENLLGFALMEVRDLFKELGDNPEALKKATEKDRLAIK